MEVEVIGGEISDAEKAEYIKTLKERYKVRHIDKIKLEIDGEYINATTVLRPIEFQRIRRITGYLVGTLDRFNNAKKLEVADRVPHGVPYEERAESGLLDE